MPTEPATRPESDLFHLLVRPTDQRRREYQYRFAQSVVFGLPVLGLQWFGHHLGGPEAARWVAVMQALLAGWVAYVGAGGMLFEGLLRLCRGRFTSDLVPASVAAGCYLWSAGAAVTIPISGELAYRPTLFHVVVLVLAGWTGIQWARWSRASRPQAR